MKGDDATGHLPPTGVFNDFIAHLLGIHAHRDPVSGYEKHSGVFGRFFPFWKIGHNFCRTIFQTLSGLARQFHQSAGRRLFTGDPLPDIFAFTSGQAAEERHGQISYCRRQTTLGQTKLLFF